MKLKYININGYGVLVDKNAGEIGSIRLEYMPHKNNEYTRVYSSINGHTILLFDKCVYKGEAGFTYKILFAEKELNLDVPILPKEMITKYKDSWKYQYKDDEIIQSLQKHPQYIVMESELKVTKHIPWDKELESKYDYEKGYPVTETVLKLITNSDGKQEGIIKEIIY